MVFADLFFIYVFLPLCLICYGLAKKLSTKNIVLIVFSIIFYAWGEPKYVLLMVVSITVGYVFGLLIEVWRGTKLSKLFLILSIVTSIGCSDISNTQISLLPISMR